ncbi:MAG: MarR family winged helix-turn-helix transcriptional regulator [Steroidobacteraceae bacterium]
MTHESPLELARFLPYRLSLLSNLVSGAIAARYSERFGLTIPQWRVMAVLAIEPGLSAADVALRTAMDKVAVSRAVATLLRAGRLERHTHAEDRRRSQLQLSETGRRVYADIVPIAREYETLLLDALDAADRDALDRIWQRLIDRARELRPATPN